MASCSSLHFVDRSVANLLEGLTVVARLGFHPDKSRDVTLSLCNSDLGKFVLQISKVVVELMNETAS